MLLQIIDIAICNVHRLQILSGWQRNLQRRIPTNNVARIIIGGSRSVNPTTPKLKLGSELDKIKQLLIENGYPADVLLYCINQKLATFAAEKTFSPEKRPVYLKLTLIGNV